MTNLMVWQRTYREFSGWQCNLSFKTYIPSYYYYYCYYFYHYY